MLNLDRLYSVIDQEEPLHELADIVAELCGTRSAQVRWQDPANGQSLDLMNYWPSKAVHRYFAEYTRSDPWLPILEMAGPGVIRGDALIPPDEIKCSEMYQELLRPLGDDTARLLAYVSSTRDPRLVLAVHRSGSDRAFDMADVRTLNTVSAHVERVLTVRSQLAAVAGTPSQGGVSLLDATGKGRVARRRQALRLGLHRSRACLSGPVRRTVPARRAALLRGARSGRLDRRVRTIADRSHGTSTDVVSDTSHSDIAAAAPVHPFGRTGPRVGR